MKINLLLGDCIERMNQMVPESITHIISDPPYELLFMSSKWDGTGIASSPKLWNAIKRVLVPGGIVKAFSSSRTYHRQAAAMYRAGFEELPMDSWAYGCLSDDSEIMVQTPDSSTGDTSWKLGVDLVPNDCIRVFDPKTLSFGWHVLTQEQIRLYDYDSDVSGNMVVLSVDDYQKGHQPWQILTPNHRVLHLTKARAGGKQEIAVTEAQNLPPYVKGTPCYIDILRDETYHTNGGTKTEMLTEECWRSPEGMPYKGKVWCVTVPTGAFVARRTVGTAADGEYLAFVTNNSGFPKSLSIERALKKGEFKRRESACIEALATTRNLKPEQVVWAAPTAQPSDTNKTHTVTVDGSPIQVQQTPTSTFIKPDYIKPEMKQVPFSGNALMRHGGDNTRPWMEEALKKGYHEQVDLSKSVCSEADLWKGWGTALKPAFEPILIGRKPVIAPTE